MAARRSTVAQSLTNTAEWPYNAQMLRLSLAALLALWPLQGQIPGQTPTIDQSLSMKQLGRVEISPDGKYAAFVVQQANWDENAFVQQIWIVNTATGDQYQLTSGKKNNRDPSWSPDSRRLAFLSERDVKPQIYVISPTGGEAAQLTSEENGVSGAFHWSPDGQKIAYISTGPESKARKDRRDKYGDFEIFEADYTMRHLWVCKRPR